MRPDPKAGRDKQRLAHKKTEKAAAKAARRAEAAKPTVDELIAALRRAKGQERGAAYRALAAHDKDIARHTLRLCVENALGKSRAELHALLADVGSDDDIDHLADGDYGDVDPVIFGDARLTSALTHLAQQHRALAPVSVARRLRGLGLVPGLSSARMHRNPPLMRAVIDVAVAVLDAGRVVDPVVVDALAHALLLTDPGVLWAHRDRVPLALAAAGGLAAEVIDDDAHDAFAAFVDDVRARVGADRHARLRAARVPACLHRLAPRPRVAIARLVIDDDALADDHLIALRTLSDIADPDVRALVLRRPGAAPDLTAAAVADLDVDEALDVLLPVWHGAQELRDRLLDTPLARAPRLLPHVVPLLVFDPMGAMAFLARNDDVDAAAIEVEAACAVVDDEVAALCLGGLCARELGPLARSTAKRRSFSALLKDVEQAPRPALVERALEALKPRTAQRAAVDDALARLRG